MKIETFVWMLLIIVIAIPISSAAYSTGKRLSECHGRNGKYIFLYEFCIKSDALIELEN